MSDTQNDDQSTAELDRKEVEDLLNDVHGDRVFAVEEDVIWVSGMNASCGRVARRMARTLTKHGIPAGLVYDDDFDVNGGVQFNYGGAV